MILLANIVAQYAGYFLAGVALGIVAFWWRQHQVKKSEALQAQSLIDNAPREAEAIIRDSRLAANEEALKIREQTEQSFAARRQERAELERRLSERETLINTQLEGVVQVERSL